MWAEDPVGSRALNAIGDAIPSQAPDARSRAWNAQEHRPSPAPRPGHMQDPTVPYCSSPEAAHITPGWACLVLSSTSPPEASYSIVFHINSRINFSSVCDEVGKERAMQMAQQVS